MDYLFCIFCSSKQKLSQPQKFTASYDSMSEFVDCCIREASSGGRPFAIISECGGIFNSADGDQSAQMKHSNAPIS